MFLLRLNWVHQLTNVSYNIMMLFSHLLNDEMPWSLDNNAFLKLKDERWSVANIDFVMKGKLIRKKVL